MTMQDQRSGARASSAEDLPGDGGTVAAATHALGDAALDVTSTARDDLGSVARQARTEARRLTDQAREELQRQADERGHQAAQRLRTMSDQLAALAEGRTQDAGPLLEYAERARDELRGWASRLEARGPQALVGDVSGFARRRPGMFLLAAAGAGFAIGRVVRAERAVQQDQPSDRAASVHGVSGDLPVMAAAEPAPYGSAPTVGSPTAASMAPRSTDG